MLTGGRGSGVPKSFLPVDLPGWTKGCRQLDAFRYLCPVSWTLHKTAWVPTHPTGGCCLKCCAWKHSEPDTWTVFPQADMEFSAHLKCEPYRWFDFPLSDPGMSWLLWPTRCLPYCFHPLGSFSPSLSHRISNGPCSSKWSEPANPAVIPICLWLKKVLLPFSRWHSPMSVPILSV